MAQLYLDIFFLYVPLEHSTSVCVFERRTIIFPLQSFTLFVACPLWVQVFAA